MLLNHWFVMNEQDEVVNVVVYDGGSWTPPVGCRLLQAVEGVDIGWRLVNNEWVAPLESDDNIVED